MSFKTWIAQKLAADPNTTVVEVADINALLAINEAGYTVAALASNVEQRAQLMDGTVADLEAAADVDAETANAAYEEALQRAGNERRNAMQAVEATRSRATVIGGEAAELHRLAAATATLG